MYSWRVNGYYGVLMLFIKGKALADDKSDLPVWSLYGLNDFIDGTDLPLN